MSFALDERLGRDAFFIGDLPLSRLLLMNDARWPWLILVPQREGVLELYDLSEFDRAVLMEEAARVAHWLKGYAEAEKLNIGALGNVVRQFHLHVVARRSGDPAWPGPVWGFGAVRPYPDAKAQATIEAAKAGLEL
jgi:diadenosine tetraphosphate (Ap4A) HIT family hydrolase